MTEEHKILENSRLVLRNLRFKNGDLPAYIVAGAINLQPTNYSQMEKGKRQIYLLDMIRLAKFYNIPLSQLAELIQMSPVEMGIMEQLQVKLDAALEENAALKKRIESFVGPGR